MKKRTELLQEWLTGEVPGLDEDFPIAAAGFLRSGVRRMRASILSDHEFATIIEDKVASTEKFVAEHKKGLAGALAVAGIMAAAYGLRSPKRR